MRTHLLQTEQWCVRGGLGATHFLQTPTTSCSTLTCRGEGWGGRGRRRKKGKRVGRGEEM